MEEIKDLTQEEKELEGFNGAILEEDIRDYKLGEISIDIPNAFNEDVFQYNQLEFAEEFGNNLCTLYFGIGMLSDLIGRKLTDHERKTLVKRRVAMPDFNPIVGGYLVEGMNCVRRWWNEMNPQNQIRQFQIETLDQITEVLKKGYRIGFGFRGNSKYNEDTVDGVLDSVDIGTTTYGHATTMKMLGTETVVDNYFGVKRNNTYRIRDIKAFIDSEITFPKLYLYLYANDAIDVEIAQLKEKYKDSHPNIQFNEEKIRQLRIKNSK